MVALVLVALVGLAAARSKISWCATAGARLLDGSGWAIGLTEAATARIALSISEEVMCVTPCAGLTHVIFTQGQAAQIC